MAAAVGREGRDESFAAWVGVRRPALVRTATLLAAGDLHLAEDLVQTALTRVYLAWPRVRQDATGGPDAYARRVLVNVYVDQTRRPWWRRERVSDTLPDRPAPAPLDVGDRDAVRTALAALPAGQRTAVVLRHWLELDVAESAALMRVTEGTVKSQTAKGLSRLRELLADDLETAAAPGGRPGEESAR